MFRRLGETLGETLFGLVDAKVRTLQNMGFNADQARHALNATDGDVDRAAELLLLSTTQSQPQPRSQSHQRQDAPRDRGGGSHDDVDEQVRRAMEESLQVEEERRVREAEKISLETRPSAPGATAPARTTRKKKPTRGGVTEKTKGGTAATTASERRLRTQTAAANKAGQAAAARFETSQRKFGTGPARAGNAGGGMGLSTTHPNVKLPSRLSSKSKEEQILRCANRLAPHPGAVDTLLRALTAVRDNPDNPKFRTIQKSNPNFQKALADKPGAEDILLAVNYRRVANCGRAELVLDRHRLDMALLYLGISALEETRRSDEYVEAKRMKAFSEEMQRMIREGGGGAEGDDAAMLRSQYLSKCPAEPPEGRGALMQLSLGPGVDKVRRRFDGDDVLKDVLNWIGAMFGPAILSKLQSREWCLVDLNRYPIAPIDCDKHAEKTLQYLGCWPSGLLEVRPSDESWKKGGDSTANDCTNGNGGAVMGSSRGLGAAPSALH